MGVDLFTGNIVSGTGGGGGSGVWGAITGDILNQTDLQTEQAAQNSAISDNANAINIAEADIIVGKKVQSRLLANGFREEFDFKIVNDGGVLYAELKPSMAEYDAGTTYAKDNWVYYSGYAYISRVDFNTGNTPDSSPTEWEQEYAWDGNLHASVDGSDRVYYLDCVTGAGTDGAARSDALTLGTDTVPVLNFIHAEHNGDLELNLVSSSTIPPGGVAFAGYVYAKSLAYFTANGFDVQHRFTNANYREGLMEGLLSAIRTKLRVMGATYYTGITPSLTIGANAGSIDDLWAINSSGKVYQLWIQDFSEFTTLTTEYIVLNHPTEPFKRITNLNEIDVDANGDSLRGINVRYGLNIVGIQNSGTDVVNKLGVLLPTGSYTTDANAINDSNNYAVTSVPFAFRFTAFRICRVVVNYTNLDNGTFTNLLGGNAVQDERGYPIGTGGGGAPSGVQNEFSDALWKIYDSANSTKDGAFELTNVPVGTTRTIDWEKLYNNTVIGFNGDLYDQAPINLPGVLATTTSTAIPDYTYFKMYWNGPDAVLLDVKSAVETAVASGVEPSFNMILNGANAFIEDLFVGEDIRSAKIDPLNNIIYHGSIIDISFDKGAGTAEDLAIYPLTKTIANAFVSVAWSFDNIEYDSKSLSIGTQDAFPRDLFFSPDGTKMYIIGDSTNTVYQYTLDSAWNIATASYDSKSFSVGTQETAPQSLFISPDGTKMYIIGTDNYTVYQYTLGTAWDIATASYDSKSFLVSTQEDTPQGIFIDHTGTKMYILGATNDTVYQYTLGTAWDIATASYDSKSFLVQNQENAPDGLYFNPAGTRMYILGVTNDTVYQYRM